MLSRVLDEAIKVVVESTGAPLSEDERAEVSSRLGKVIIDHFTAGETDPERLKKIAIESAQRP